MLLDRVFGGARRDRTADLLHAMQALSQLSYSPTGGATLLDPLNRVKEGQNLQVMTAFHCPDASRWS